MMSDVLIFSTDTANSSFKVSSNSYEYLRWCKLLKIEIKKDDNISHFALTEDEIEELINFLQKIKE
jgi:hypothetical protein